MLTATFAYTYNFFSGDEKLLKVARIGYHIGAIFVILTAGYLMDLVLTHQFQYTYIWSYSSYEIHPPLLVSTFYVGQQGSFMLWTMYTAIIGLILMAYSRKHHYESSVMGIFSSIATFLILMAVVKNPFERVWQTWPQTVPVGHFVSTSVAWNTPSSYRPFATMLGAISKLFGFAPASTTGRSVWWSSTM